MSIYPVKLLDYLEAQPADEVFSFRYLVQRLKELFCVPAPSEGR